jgi:hypothetical protein
MTIRSSVLTEPAHYTNVTLTVDDIGILIVKRNTAAGTQILAMYSQPWAVSVA